MMMLATDAHITVQNRHIPSHTIYADNICWQVSPFQVSPLQVSPLQVSPMQIGTLQVSPMQIGTLQGANLHGADLQGANLHGADLQGANLQGANLKWADLPTDVIRIDGMRWDVTILYGYMRIGCQHHHVDDWDKFTNDEISKMDSKALEFWQANKQKLITIANFTKE